MAIDDTLESISKLISYHEQGQSEVYEKTIQLDNGMRQIDEEITKIHEQISHTQHNSRHIRRILNVCVFLESEKGGEVELDISYQVTCASWHPTYEIRVQSATNTLKLSYFGQISQCTGEDWLDTSLVLSTARPSLAGTMPTLGTLNAEFYKPPPRRIQRPHRSAQCALFGSIQPMRQVQKCHKLN
ncbi:unnamed protein product [Gongylonema pulchrum]|uniref:DUF4139 domain-containing protein n=1 Tax=Gongylonema pulchrum TaxID=637853 RepID=A0A183DN89_9BILA|nr:unnamed protein product [Gongylonema pulchrum]